MIINYINIINKNMYSALWKFSYHFIFFMFHIAALC